MATRDYAARGGSKKKKKSANKPLLFAIAAGLVIAFAGGLYFLKQKAPAPQVVPTVKEEKTKPKSQLPSRPEETWSYIKELESRTITNDQSIQLNEKQKAELKRLEAEEKAKKEALEKLKQEEALKAAKAQAEPEVQAVLTQMEADQKAAEKKQAEQRKKEELAKAEKAKKTEVAKAEAKKVEAKEQKKPEPKKAEAPKLTGKFGLQCGAFNDRTKAENLQARLAMSGLNARITESGKWNRVLVGPVGDRTAAVAAQKQASSITGCVVIGM